jgi:hypothetical protein
MNRRPVDLHIEELILDGFAAVDGERIRFSVERELTRLLVEGGMPGTTPENASVASLKGGQIAVGPGVNGVPGGRHIARAIYGAMTR